MGRVSRATTTEKNPVEYQQGVKRAKASRRKVAKQLSGLIETAEMTGSHPLVGRRISAYAEALQSGDHFAIRGALMELGQAAGATVAAMDLVPPARRGQTPRRAAA
jgi:hypothetical protein